jgi:hypothetical protein
LDIWSLQLVWRGWLFLLKMAQTSKERKVQLRVERSFVLLYKQCLRKKQKPVQIYIIAFFKHEYVITNKLQMATYTYMNIFTVFLFLTS